MRNFEFRISDFGFSTCDLRIVLRAKGAINGGAWHPDSRKRASVHAQRVSESACLVSSREGRWQKTASKPDHLTNITGAIDTVSSSGCRRRQRRDRDAAF